MSVTKLPEWLDALMDEYPTKRTDKAIARLYKVYADMAEDVMSEAAYAYMKAGKFFPKVADLNQYVKEAEEMARGTPFEESPGRPPTDEELLAFEQARGTMPPTKEHRTYWSIVADAVRGFK